MSVEELELVVSRLAADELALFSQWFDEFRAQQWDRQIEADILAGKLDRLASVPMMTSSPVVALPFETFCLTRILVSLPRWRLQEIRETLPIKI